MENATKALIIAGAVLVAILLISFGILLVNQNKDSMDASKNLSNAMSETSKKGANNAIQTLTNL